MSYSVNIRNQYLEHTPGDEEQINPHWEGYLKDSLANALYGYDLAVDIILKTLTDESVLFDLLTSAKIDTANRLDIDESVLESDRIFSEYSDEEKAQMSIGTRLFKAIQEHLMGYTEIIRNDYGISLIETMTEEEYDEMVNLVDNEGYQNAVIESYEE